MMARIWRRRLASAQGQFLAEVTVATALLALLLLGLSRTLVVIIRTEDEAAQRLHMAHLAQAKLAELGAAAWHGGLPRSPAGATANPWQDAGPAAAGLEWKWSVREWGESDGSGRKPLVQVQVDVRCPRCRSDAGPPEASRVQIVPGL